MCLNGSRITVNGNKILKNICEYPYQLNLSRHKSVSPSSRRSIKSVNRSSRDKETTPFRFRRHNVNKLNETLPELKKLRAKKLPKIKLVLSKRAELKQNTYYNIQIQKNRKNRHLYLIAQNESKKVRNDDYYIDLPKKEANVCKKIFNNDFNTMIESISIQDDKLVLLNPNYTTDDKSRNQDALEGTTGIDVQVNNTIS